MRRRDLLLQLTGLRSLWDRLAGQRGEYIAQVIGMEEAIDDLTMDSLGIDPGRRELFAGALLAHVELSAKIDALRVLLQADEFLRHDAVKDLTRRLDSVRQFRNLCAHAPPLSRSDDDGKTVLHLMSYTRSGKEHIVRVDEASMNRRLTEATEITLELMTLRLVRLDQVSPKGSREEVGGASDAAP
jgi:hypothetical protein